MSSYLSRNILFRSYYSAIGGNGSLNAKFTKVISSTIHVDYCCFLCICAFETARTNPKTLVSFPAGFSLKAVATVSLELRVWFVVVTYMTIILLIVSHLFLYLIHISVGSQALSC